MNEQETRERKAIVVLGMHRSGTSALAGALGACGYALPADPMPPQSDNPNGFHEPLGIVRINNDMLAELGGSWDRPGPFLFPHRGLSASERIVGEFQWTHWRKKAEAALEHSFSGKGDFVLKDPRMCTFLPFWDRVLQAVNVKPVYVLIYRSPMEIAASLQKRNGFGSRRVLQLWQVCHQAVFSFDENRSLSSVVSYSALTENPTATVVSVLRAIRPQTSLDVDEAGLVRKSVQPESRHHRLDETQIQTAPLIPPLVRDTWSLLKGWEGIEPRLRREQMAALKRRFEDVVLLSGPVIAAPQSLAQIVASKASQEESGMAAPPPQPGVSPQTRSSGSPSTPDATPLLILHYHLFKNAGTSVDEILKRNFGDRWEDAEFVMPDLKPSNVESVAAHLRERPYLIAFSSHTALLPPPEIKGRIIFPIIFVRHPIERLRSAYSFERKQVADTFGAKLAKAEAFPGYIERLLDGPRQRQARNFHTYRFSHNEPPAAGSERERALRTLDALPFVGLVEEFDRSVEFLKAKLAPHLPNFETFVVHRNRTTGEARPLDVKLAEIEKEIGSALYAKLADANADDLDLYRRLKDRYATDRAPNSG